MSRERDVTVFGAYGHTGRFVVAELLQRGWTPILAGRDESKLAELAAAHPQLQRRIATVDDAASLDRALHGACAVINCAGPYSETAFPLVEAALRARIDYLDACAEQPAVSAVRERFDAAARAAGTAIVPAMAFFGGLADLLATAAMGDWPAADSIDVAVALDSWHPTAGTRITGERNRTPRRIVTNGELATMPAPPPTRSWDFGAPFGTQEVTMLPLSEIVSIASHLRAGEVRSYMNLAPLKDLRDPATPPPQRSDARGRSAQRFLVEVRVRRDGRTRRASAAGQDIYAISAPLLVEALERVHAGPGRRSGVIAPGAAFAPQEFLAALGDLEFSLGETDRQST